MNDKPIKQISFSRQVFTLFLLTAILPVILLSLFAYMTLSERFESSINRHVYSESRSLGLTLFDRLQNMKRNLLYFSDVIESSTLPYEKNLLGEQFTSVYIYEQGRVAALLFGDTYTSINLSDEQKQHLQNEALLMLVEDGQVYDMLMITALDIEKERYLVGVINHDYLWNVTIKETDFFCAGVKGREILYCSNGFQKAYQEKINAEIIRDIEKHEFYSITLDDERYVGNTWGLFTGPNFGMREIYIHYFIPYKTAFFDADFYIKVLPQTILITLLLVSLFSSVQVRRLLAPLEKLIKGANDIIAGKLGVQVDIESHNEFKTLGDTFNNMSSRMEEQVNELETLAKLDRLILSTPDTEFIVDILLQYVPKVLPQDNMAIVVFDSSSMYMATIYYKQHLDVVSKSNLIIDENEHNELENASGILEKNTSSYESYLSPLKQFNNQQFLIIPVRNKESLLAIMIIGLSNKQTDLSIYMDSAPQLADRVAVAFSNANWEKKLFYQAHYDELTGLPNRLLFKDRFQQAVERAKRANDSISILFIDLDRFKSVNDSLGHEVGDRLLQQVGQRLIQCVRAYDSVARFGGDEFCVIITDAKPEQIGEQSVILAERIIDAMRTPIPIDKHEIFVSPSIGIAIYPQDGKNYDEILKQADIAMYQAKSMSTANYRFYDQNQDKHSYTRLELESELRHALEQNQFDLYYQPKVDLKDGKIRCVEALVRWQHPKKGMIGPDNFISIAEETGVINDMGYWVLEESCRQNREWHEQGINLKIAVNISSDQFKQPDFFEKTEAILHKTGVNPESLELEITESIYIEQHEEATQLLNRLKDYGMSICMDDFGTGYSSMTYLQNIPVDKLKIDKSFIANINKDKSSTSIVNAIVTMAHSLELEVVAEGVEKAEQYDYLKSIHCDEVQGYFICHPLPVEELIAYLNDSKSRLEMIE